jgi:hypothetical protein
MLAEPRSETYRDHRRRNPTVSAINRMLPRLPLIAALAAMLVVGSLLLRQERMLPVTFTEDGYAFPYGPLAGAVGQSFAAPAPYLSRVSVTIDAQGISASGFPLNLRIRDDQGEVVAEARLTVNRPGISVQAISFSPIADSEGRVFEIEIQPAEGAEGDIYLPMRAGSGLPGESFRDQEAGLGVDWSSNYRLRQTVRPLTFIRATFAADPVTGMGLIAALTLLVGALGAVSRGVGWVLRFRLDLSTTGVFGTTLALALFWAAFAMYPVA